MQIPLLTPQKDPMGAAIADYFANGKASKLRVIPQFYGNAGTGTRSTPHE